jgi:hypothetical protein
VDLEPSLIEQLQPILGSYPDNCNSSDLI